jgi:hypothetical protein
MKLSVMQTSFQTYITATEDSCSSPVKRATGIAETKHHADSEIITELLAGLYRVVSMCLFAAHS